MSITSGFFNAKFVAGFYDRVYNADEFTKCFQGFISDGIVGKSKATSTSFKVIKGPNDSKKIFVKPGYAWINGRWIESNSDIEFEVETPSIGGERGDLVCIRCDYDQREITVILKQGQVSQGYPDLQDDVHAKEIPLAYLLTNGIIETIEDVILRDAREMAEVKINASNMNGLVLIKCTQEEYDQMAVHDSNTIYYVEANGKIKQYMGETEIGGAAHSAGNMIPLFNNYVDMITGTIEEE